MSTPTAGTYTDRAKAKVAERKSAISKEVRELERRIQRLKSEHTELSGAYPIEVQRLAVRLHELGCPYEHTESCAWHYDDERPFALARGRIRYAKRALAVLDQGLLQPEGLDALLDLLPDADIEPAPERVRAPSKSEREVCELMTRAFQRRYEGAGGWGPGWDRSSSYLYGGAKRRWALENSTEHPWAGIQHRRYLAAARAWRSASGMTWDELIDVLRGITSEGGQGA